LSDQREELIGRYNQTALFSLLIPDNHIFIGDYGHLLISIRDNEITGRAAEEVD